MFGAAAAAQRTKDVELVQPPPDSVSKIAFSPTSDILAVASWDNNVSGICFHPPDGRSKSNWVQCEDREEGLGSSCVD